MNSLLAFMPFLALVAFMSIEVAAQAAIGTTYSSLVSATPPHINGLESVYTVTENGKAATPPGCSETEVKAGGCEMEPVSWDNGALLSVAISMPANLSVPAGMKPSKFKVALCYSAPDQVNRAWRKYNDVFKKDKTCIQMTDALDYNAGETVTTDVKIKSVVPSVTLTIQTFVICEDVDGVLQGNNNFCHLGNPPNTADNQQIRDTEEKLFFKTVVMKNRPNNLWVAVFICAALGPLMLFAFLIYERGIMAKRA